MMTPTLLNNFVLHRDWWQRLRQFCKNRLNSGKGVEVKALTPMSFRGVCCVVCKGFRPFFVSMAVIARVVQEVPTIQSDGFGMLNREARRNKKGKSSNLKGFRQQKTVADLLECKYAGLFVVVDGMRAPMVEVAKLAIRWWWTQGEPLKSDGSNLSDWHIEEYIDYLHSDY